MLVILVQNVALLVALVMVYQLIARNWHSRHWLVSIFSGLLFGSVCVVSMITPFVFTEGIVVDGRSIILGVAGFFGGPVVAVTAVLVSAAFRLWMGGAGANIGVTVITVSAGIGVLFYYLRQSHAWVTRPHALWLFGLIIHAIMIALLWQLPDGERLVRLVGLPVIILFPLATLLLCRMFLETEKQIATERKLHESEERHRTTLLSIGDAVISTDNQGRVELMNEHAEALTGWSQAEAAGRCLEDIFTIVSEDTRETVQSPTQAVFSDGHIVGLANHTLLISRDGSERPIADSAAPIVDSAGNLTGAVLVFRDQSAEREAEKALVESERKLASLMSHVPGMVYRFENHPQWALKFASEAGLEITGYTLTELLGEDGVAFASLIDREDLETVRRGIDEAVRHKQAYTLTYRIHPAQGGIKWVEDRGRGVFAESGEIICLEGLILDISERLRAEEEKHRLEEDLRHAQKMEAVGRLAGGVAHDFNNMLTVINGHAELALQSPHAVGPLRDYLAAILKAGSRSADLTRQLLAYARKQPIRPELLDLNQAISGLLNMLRRLIREQIELDWKPSAKAATVKIDAAQFDQIMVNLILNARDAIEEFGTLSIATSHVDIKGTEDAPVPGMQAAAYVRLTVKDDGSGMDAHTLAHIFEPFFTTKAQDKGTGLGMATVYGAVTQNEGHIKVTSSPHQGSQFDIYFRAQTPAKVDTDGGTDKHPAQVRANITIMLVEDEPGILKLNEMTLRKLGYRVLCAATPETALGLAASRGHAIDLLVTDVIMPRMNGYQLWQKLHAVRPLKCLFVSGYPADVLDRLSKSVDEKHFLQKPFSLDDFVDKIHAILAEVDHMDP